MAGAAGLYGPMSIEERSAQIVQRLTDEYEASVGALRGAIRDASRGWYVRDIIVAINNIPVRRSVDLLRELDRHEVGQVVELEVLRVDDSERRKLKIEHLDIIYIFAEFIGDF